MCNFRKTRISLAHMHGILSSPRYTSPRDQFRNNLLPIDFLRFSERIVHIWGFRSRGFICSWVISNTWKTVTQRLLSGFVLSAWIILLLAFLQRLPNYFPFLSTRNVMREYLGFVHYWTSLSTVKCTASYRKGCTFVVGLSCSPIYSFFLHDCRM